MNVYLSQSEELSKTQQLKDNGFLVTSTYDCGDEDFPQLEQIEFSDVVIILPSPDRTFSNQSMVEAGIAIAFNKKIIIVHPNMCDLPSEILGIRGLALKVATFDEAIGIVSSWRLQKA